jgi:methionyl-tRNA formyltransferase
VRLGKKRFAGRIERIVEENGLEEEPKPEHRVTRVASINSPEFIAAIERLDPKAILLAGCRIVRPQVLSTLRCPVLNYHAGITPQYRGMNGGYWALACGDRENFGGTVHLVDEGIDTGAVVYQARGLPGSDDNLMTYTHCIAALSRSICVAAVRDALDGKLRPTATSGVSRQWYHPTIWQYLWTGLTRGVW